MTAADDLGALSLPIDEVVLDLARDRDARLAPGIAEQPQCRDSVSEGVAEDVLRNAEVAREGGQQRVAGLLHRAVVARGVFAPARKSLVRGEYRRLVEQVVGAFRGKRAHEVGSDLETFAAARFARLEREPTAIEIGIPRREVLLPERALLVFGNPEQAEHRFAHRGARRLRERHARDREKADVASGFADPAIDGGAFGTAGLEQRGDIDLRDHRRGLARAVRRVCEVIRGNVRQFSTRRSRDAAPDWSIVRAPPTAPAHPRT